MLWGEEVGKLYWDERSKRAVFNYHPDFIKKGVEIAPLTASVKGSAAKGMPILGNREKIYQGLPPFLADSLPDRWGNMVFDQWAAQNHIPKRKLTPVDKLSFIPKPWLLSWMISIGATADYVDQRPLTYSFRTCEVFDVPRKVRTAERR